MDWVIEARSLGNYARDHNMNQRGVTEVKEG